MLRRRLKIAAMLLRNSAVFESFHPPSVIFPNLSNFRGIAPILVPIVGLRASALGNCSRTRDSVCSRFERSRMDYVLIQAVSDGGSGGGRGFTGSGDAGNGGWSGEESGGKDWSLLSWYLTALDKHPVITKALTSAFLTFIGDLICQILIDQVPKLDEKRTLVFTFLGFMLVGPVLHFWYLSLSKLITMPGVSGASLRLLLDQFFFSPIFIGFFLSALVTLEGRPSQVLPKLQQEWFSSMLANWQLWIPFQFLNFQFVPQKFQVLAANLVALVWNVILSFKAHKEIVVK
ncbi:hypothetical protein KSP39_PZI016946 [Platanthera zijinensis]|uniref:Uncharacterized protein n=1 Tax=Platanthera zijinensis TaxID=2320716 RepID=A0AAP0B7N7_9ASPA